MDLRNFDVNEVEEFVSKIFNIYKLNREDFFGVEDEEGDMCEWPFFPEDYVDIETLHKLRQFTGFTEEELISLDEEILHKYWNQYDFFELDNDFFTSSLLSDITPDALLIRLFGIDEPSENIHYKRYDVKKRMIRKLHELDSVMPGTWRQGADIEHLEIETENLFSYPQCRKMMMAVLKMIDDLKKLFFKAIDEDLSAQEQDRLNFLVNCLYVTDICLPTTRITYDNIQIYKEVYRKENLSDFLSYVTIRRLFELQLWKCKEFFDDLTVSEKYLNLIIDSKRRLSDFSMIVSKFKCEYIWSDNEICDLIRLEEEQMKQGVDPDEFIEYFTTEEYAEALNTIWIDKTDDELGDWKPYIQRIRMAASPVKIGGVKAPYREHGAFGPILLSDGTTDDRHHLRVVAQKEHLAKQEGQ